MQLESLLQYLDGYLGVRGHPDYRTALNGLQVEGPEEVRRIAAAVDTSESTIREAAEMGADLMLVHHGLFWDGLRPVTGRRFRKLATLIRENIALYSAHLPLDGHAEVGNSALLSDALGAERTGRFAWYEGSPIGWTAELPSPLAPGELTERIAQAVSGPVHHIPGGPATITSLGVVTGGGASFLEEAADLGLDALVTGEGSHHTHVDAMELGVHVYLAGHYATETFGVRALAAHLADRFDLTWAFIDDPTGL